MNLRISARTRIALGLVALLVSVLMGAVAAGLVPNNRDAILRGRVALCESIAVSSSVLAQRNDLAGLQAALEGIARRDGQILSAAVRREDGRIVAVTGADHERNWLQKAPGDAHVYVPIHSNQHKWGTVELRLTALDGGGILGILTRPDVKLTLFVAGACFILYQFYLRKMLQHLDPSKVVPGRVRSALDTLAEGLLVLDSKERIVLANHAFATLAGRSPDALMGVRVSTLPWVSDPDQPAGESPWASSIQGAAARRNMTLRLRDVDGAVRTFVVNCSPVLGQDGQHRGVFASFEDVTQLERQKVELGAARDAAEAANRSKSEFLARMSHEIRTPMNAILGFADVLRRGYEQSEAERQEYLDTIHASGQHLLELINDILDLSKIESGRMTVERQRCSPHEIVTEVVNVLQVRAQEKRLALSYEWSGEVPQTIETDPTRLRQVLTNLVGNGIKFTEAGGVRVVVRLSGQETLAIDVIDSGIGIAPDDAARLFQPFVQADTSITRRFGGTGLGLAISRQLAQALGGDITITSAPGKGSCFTCSIDTGPLDGVALLPAPPQSAAPARRDRVEAGAVRLPPLRVLSIEDGASNQKLITLVLARAGAAIVDTALNGRAGVDMALAGAYDVILMDMQMPVMDGYSATALLRQRGLETPIIAMTAHAMKGEEARCLAVGCSAFVAKPIDMDDLVRTIARAVEASPLGASPPSREPQGPGAADPGEAAMAAVTAAAAGWQDDAIKSTLPTDDPDFREVVEEFVDRLRTQMDDLHAAWEQRELARVAELAHWLKGSGGTAGFGAFTAPAKRLEQLARDAEVEQIGRTLEEIQALVSRVSAAPTAPATPAPAARAPHGGAAMASAQERA